MGNCKYFHEQIELELDGELSDQERTELREHLQNCTACFKYREEALALWSALETNLQLDPPADLAAPVLARLAKRKTWRLAGIAAIILIAGISSLPILLQGATWVLTALFDLDLHWVPQLFGTIWQTVKILFKSWILLSEALPDQFWLGLAALAVADLAMLVRVFGNRLAKGGSIA